MLCRFCEGTGSFFYLRYERPAWWKCRACQGSGVRVTPGPIELRISKSQMQFLKPYPESQKGSQS